MQSYDALSVVYDLFADDFDHAKWAEYYRALLRRAGVEPQSLVDAGCGTGRMTVELAREGARVVGVDISEGMLRVAAERLRREGVRAQLAHEDMCRLRVPRPVDAVICACDGVNYLLSAERVRAFFRARARGHPPRRGAGVRRIFPLQAGTVARRRLFRRRARGGRLPLAEPPR